MARAPTANVPSGKVRQRVNASRPEIQPLFDDKPAPDHSKGSESPDVGKRQHLSPGAAIVKAAATMTIGFVKLLAAVLWVTGLACFLWESLPFDAATRMAVLVPTLCAAVYKLPEMQPIRQAVLAMWQLTRLMFAVAALCRLVVRVLLVTVFVALCLQGPLLLLFAYAGAVDAADRAGESTEGLWLAKPALFVMRGGSRLLTSAGRVAMDFVMGLSVRVTFAHVILLLTTVQQLVVVMLAAVEGAKQVAAILGQLSKAVLLVGLLARAYMLCRPCSAFAAKKNV